VRKVYGYRNVKQGVVGDRHTHVLREIDPAQADVVRRILEMTASGMGLLRIARTLGAEGVRSPSGAGWGTTSLAWVLNRELYRGQVVYGKTAKPPRGSKKKVKIPGRRVDRA